MISRCLALAMAVLLAPGVAIACEPAAIGKDASRINGQHFVLAWRVEPAPLRLGEFFSVIVSTCERRSQYVVSLKVDATMPAHKHGMNYLPTVTAEGNGRFAARGLLLHMPGRWEFAFDLAGDGARETLRANIDLK